MMRVQKPSHNKSPQKIGQRTEVADFFYYWPAAAALRSSVAVWENVPTDTCTVVRLVVSNLTSKIIFFLFFVLYVALKLSNDIFKKRKKN
jgi:hypothetical protein